MGRKADLETEIPVADAFEHVDEVRCEKRIENAWRKSIIRHNWEIKAAMARQLAEMGISDQGIERVLNFKVTDQGDS